MARKTKKERRRLKRKAKRKQTIRLKNQSPFQRVLEHGKVARCVVNEDWRERGQAVLFVMAAVPDRPPMLANFFIDLWCAGLKDAWGRREFHGEDFRPVIEDAEAGMQMHFIPCDVAEARRLVTGGIRFARDNGFRVPEETDRWAALLGGLEDVDAADVSDFGVEDGKLHWVGPMSDLRDRLVGCTVEEFLAREDVDYMVEVGEEEWLPEFDNAQVIHDSEWDEEDVGEPAVETDRLDPRRCRICPDRDDCETWQEHLNQIEEMGASLRKLAEELVSDTRRWCFTHGEVPHPDMAVAALALLVDAGAEVIRSTGANSEATQALLEQLHACCEAAAPDIAGALPQIRRAVRSLANAEGLDPAALPYALKEQGRGDAPPQD